MKKSVHFVMNERKALAAVSESPFIINLKYSFHSDDEVYLVLDLMSGGDLGFHLHQKRRFGPNQCLYYAARIMLGLQALHDKGYAYRDLKPENCLLSEDGRVKLTDLGLAVRLEPKLPTGVVGTRGYWAPEMHKRDEAGKRIPYNHAVDWFSFGCCIAEFICGKNPFRSEAAYKFGVDKGEKAKVSLARSLQYLDLVGFGNSSIGHSSNTVPVDAMFKNQIDVWLIHRTRRWIEPSKRWSRNLTQRFLRLMLLICADASWIRTPN